MADIDLEKYRSDSWFGWRDVEEAAKRLEPYLPWTPLAESFYLGGTGKSDAPADGRRYAFKLESMQRAKSFKIRGALNKMLTLTDEEKARGVATVSSGNHGSSVALAGNLLGVPATVIIPEGAPASKQYKIEYFGGTCLRMGAGYDEAHRLGMDYIEQHGLTYVDAYYDDPKIYGGQGTIAWELLQQDPDVDTIVVPFGGGGMTTGIATWAKHVNPDIRIVAVQTEACPALKAALKDGVFYDEYPVSGATLCDATVGGLGALSYARAASLIDQVVIVSEDEIAEAVSFMAKEEKYVAEGASCMPVAAVRHHREEVGGSDVALIISGGNIDGAALQACLDRY